MFFVIAAALAGSVVGAAQSFRSDSPAQQLADIKAREELWQREKAASESAIQRAADAKMAEMPDDGRDWRIQVTECEDGLLRVDIV